MALALSTSPSQLLQLVEEAIETQEAARQAFNHALTLQAKADTRLAAVALEIAVLAETER